MRRPAFGADQRQAAQAFALDRVVQRKRTSYWPFGEPCHAAGHERIRALRLPAAEIDGIASPSTGVLPASMFVNLPLRCEILADDGADLLRRIRLIGEIGGGDRKLGRTDAGHEYVQLRIRSGRRRRSGTTPPVFAGQASSSNSCCIGSQKQFFNYLATRRTDRAALARVAPRRGAREPASHSAPPSASGRAQRNREGRGRLTVDVDRHRVRALDGAAAPPGPTAALPLDCADRRRSAACPSARSVPRPRSPARRFHRPHDVRPHARRTFSA